MLIEFPPKASKITLELAGIAFELTDFGRRLAPSKLNPNYKRPWYMYNLELKIVPIGTVEVVNGLLSVSKVY